MQSVSPSHVPTHVPQVDETPRREPVIQLYAVWHKAKSLRRGTKVRQGIFLVGASVFVLGAFMRRPLSYLLAVAVLLGAGYGGLHLLSKPQEPSQRQVEKPASKTMNVAEKSDLPSLTEGTQAENGPKIRGKAEPSGGPAPPASSNEATADAPPQTKEDPQAPTKRAEDVAPGGCMPFGITVQGELVFPMLCQELLARNRGSGDFEGPAPTNSNSPTLTLKGDQKAEAPKSVGEGSANHKPTEPPGSEANAKLEDTPWTGGAKSGKGNGETHVKTERKVEKRNFRNSNPDGMTAIMRTIFPRW
jgi:hypothetical protein